MEDAGHLMRRAGFGGSPEEIRKVHELGREVVVDALLAPEEPFDKFPLPDWAANSANEIAERMADHREFRKGLSSKSEEERAKVQQARIRGRQREYRQRLSESSRWWFNRMMRTRAPLREKMVLFWHDHFATSAQKVRLPHLLLGQNELFRRNAVGDFKQLTHKILMDPAMMLYLDTSMSKKSKPNENFAREVLELFTLGEGNFTEDDIKEAARAFTGYTVNLSLIHI